VLLLHGASANHGSFTTPRVGVKGERLPSLVQWLAADFDPWLLDWRGTGLEKVVRKNTASLTANGHAYNFNAAARYDLPLAIATIRDRLKITAPIAVLGHCMGSAILTEAVALGHVKPAEVDCIVLSALGLFYETPIDGRLKSEERLLERLIADGRKKGRPSVKIDPSVTTRTREVPLRSSWPETLDKLYQTWPGRLKSHTESAIRNAAREKTVSCPERASSLEMCNRLSFMYGVPYHHANLIDEIHGTESIKPELPAQFGAIPLHMYIHGARNIRRGRATCYRQAFQSEENASKRDVKLLSDHARDRFRALEKVTLITGALNRLWHRDSIDLMYEWLRRGPSKHRCQFTKRVFAGYGHQDLFWGKNAARDVFETIKDGLE
jgi:pimeloyl-ACP methyl ester carboxylesterase